MMARYIIKNQINNGASIIQIFDVYIDGERAQRISVKPDKEAEDMI